MNRSVDPTTTATRIRRRRRSAAATAFSGNVLALAAIYLSFAGQQGSTSSSPTAAVEALSLGNGLRSKLISPISRRIPTSRNPANDDARLLVAAAHHLGRYPWGATTTPTHKQTGTSRMLHSGVGSISAPSPPRPTSALSATKLDAETHLAQLQQENDILRLQVAELEEENLRLHKHGGLSPENIVIERFEGERVPIFDDNGEEILPWYERDDEEEDGDDVVLPGQKALVAKTTEVSLSSTPIQKKKSEVEKDIPDLTAATKASSSKSIADDGACIETEYDGLTCPIEPDVSFGDALRDRAYWLCGLLAMQSLSGFILARNEVLLQNHPVIIYFLTMLVGAGGNAGNQASVRVIRGLALGTLNESTQRQFLNREFKMAACLCGLLSTAGFIRAWVFRTPLPETIAITTSLALIVFSSIGLGAVLPFFLQKLKVDPAHSSTSIQVIMDILGVVITVFVSTLMLDSPVGQYIVSKLS